MASLEGILFLFYLRLNKNRSRHLPLHHSDRNVLGHPDALQEIVLYALWREHVDIVLLSWSSGRMHLNPW